MNFDNSYSRLPNVFYKTSSPSHFQNPELIAFNQELAIDLGFKYQNYTQQELAKIFSGQTMLAGSNFISLVYAAHQFGHFVPQLGDGRAILIGEVISKTGKRFDLQLKGAGPTVYSRRGDGFSALGPVLREYILSEFMNSINIKTTRSLAAVITHENVYREDVIPGGIFTRVASSHIRIGTFQYFYGQNDLENLKILLNYSIQRHYPEIINNASNEKDYPILFLRQVIKAQVDLVASWMSVGFIHGVMNTDNMSISGETIDYGPCAFMDYFNYNQVYSFIDRNSRYSYINQSNIMAWNLARLADTLVPIIKDNFSETDQFAVALLEKELSSIKMQFEDIFNKKISKKLGLEHSSIDDNIKSKMISEFFQTLSDNKLDYTTSFRKLSAGLLTGNIDKNLSLFFNNWKNLLLNGNCNLEQISQEMDLINPAIIPRNHMVEKMINLALAGDLSLLHQMIEIYKNPFIENSIDPVLGLPPSEDEIVANTFCGT